MTMNYVRKDISRSNDMYMELLQHAVDVNYSEMKDYNDERYNLDNYYTFYATNPYYMIDNYRSNYQDDRVYGRIEMSYEIMKGLRRQDVWAVTFLTTVQTHRSLKLLSPMALTVSLVELRSH